MDAVHDVLDTKVNEKPFEDRRQNCWLFQAHRRHTMLREQFVRHIVTESALEVDMGHSETSQCAYAPCHLLDPHQDLKHCTASLTRGVVKFAQALCENHRRNQNPTGFGTADGRWPGRGRLSGPKVR